MIMKSFSLLLLSASVAVGHVAQIPRRDLIVRAGQGVENLDNEPDYEDPVSGDKTPKSRILTGLGPDAAINRFFDWDESCTDEKHRKKIAATFANVLTLTGYASGHLDQLSQGLDPQPGSSTNKRNQQTIFDIDPAYAQMFLGLDNQIKYVKGSFDLISGEAPKPGADRGGNKPGALRFICNADDHVMNGDGSAKYCGSGAEAAQAIATTPYEPTKFLPTIEPRYSFETSSSVTFCPKFFDDGEFPNVDVHAGSNEQTLDKIDCAERILLHEYMHLPWIRNMPGNPDKPDVIGYFNSAEYARKAGWGNIKVNPDNYAWFALYAYFNNNNNGCGADVWPGNGSDKPNKKPR